MAFYLKLLYQRSSKTSFTSVLSDSFFSLHSLQMPRIEQTQPRCPSTVFLALKNVMMMSKSMMISKTVSTGKAVSKAYNLKAYSK